MKTKTHILKTRTIGGDLAKQYYFGEKFENNEEALIIYKLILANRNDEYYCKHFQILKVFKDKALFSQVFGIKISSLAVILDTLSK